MDENNRQFITWDRITKPAMSSKEVSELRVEFVELFTLVKQAFSTKESVAEVNYVGNQQGDR